MALKDAEIRPKSLGRSKAEPLKWGMLFHSCMHLCIDCIETGLIKLLQFVVQYAKLTMLVSVRASQLSIMNKMNRSLLLEDYEISTFLMMCYDVLKGSLNRFIRFFLN